MKVTCLNRPGQVVAITEFIEEDGPRPLPAVNVEFRPVAGIPQVGIVVQNHEASLNVKMSTIMAIGLRDELIRLLKEYPIPLFATEDL